MGQVFPENERNTWAAQTTTDSYADLGDAWAKPHLLTATFVISNDGSSNSADVKVLGSVDGGATYPVEALAETEVAANAVHELNVTNYYTHLKIQVKATVSGSQTDVSAAAAGIAL